MAAHPGASQDGTQIVVLSPTQQILQFLFPALGGYHREPLRKVARLLFFPFLWVSLSPQMRNNYNAEEQHCVCHAGLKAGWAGVFGFTMKLGGSSTWGQSKRDLEMGALVAQASSLPSSPHYCSPRCVCSPGPSLLIPQATQHFSCWRPFSQALSSSFSGHDDFHLCYVVLLTETF